MKIRQILMLLLSLAGLGRMVLAQAPAVAYSEDGILYLATASGRVIKTIKSKIPIGQIAVSADARQAVFVPVEKLDAYGGPLYTLNIGTGKVSLLARPPHGYVYADPDYAPNQSQVVVAVHGSHGDLVEASGPLAVVDMKTYEVRILRATLNVNQGGPAFANSPSWSPSGSRILMNFEDGAAVTDPAGQHLQDITDALTSEDWSNAIGWLGDGCVVFVAGKDPVSAEAAPAQAFVLGRHRVLGLAGLLEVPERSVTNLRAVSSAILVRRAGSHYEVAADGRRWTIPYRQGRSFITLLRPGDDAPAACNGHGINPKTGGGVRSPR